MNPLDSAIKDALFSSGNLKEANKAYLEFIKANFIIPLEKNSNDENPSVLFLQDKNFLFLPVFTEIHYLDAWALEIRDDIKLLRLSGVDLIKGIGEKVTVCLNIGSDFYKEFLPDEIARMRSMVIKFFNSNTGT
jgi:hypothetical protein